MCYKAPVAQDGENIYMLWAKTTLLGRKDLGNKAMVFAKPLGKLGKKKLNAQVLKAVEWWKNCVTPVYLEFHDILMVRWKMPALF